MNEEKPKIIGVFKELDLIAQEVHIKVGSEHPAGDSEYYVVESDPDVTETMTCTDCVCSTTEAKFAASLSAFQVKFVLPPEMRLANEVNVKLRRQSR